MIAVISGFHGYFVMSIGETQKVLKVFSHILRPLNTVHHKAGGLPASSIKQQSLQAAPKLQTFLCIMLPVKGSACMQQTVGPPWQQPRPPVDELNQADTILELGSTPCPKPGGMRLEFRVAPNFADWNDLLPRCSWVASVAHNTDALFFLQWWTARTRAP